MDAAPPEEDGAPAPQPLNMVNAVMILIPLNIPPDLLTPFFIISHNPLSLHSRCFCTQIAVASMLHQGYQLGKEILIIS